MNRVMKAIIIEFGSIFMMLKFEGQESGLMKTLVSIYNRYVDNSPA